MVWSMHCMWASCAENLYPVVGIVHYNGNDLWTYHKMHWWTKAWKLTFPMKPYSSIVSQMASAIFFPECSQISSRKSSRSSSVRVCKCMIELMIEWRTNKVPHHWSCSVQQWPKRHVDCLMSMHQVKGRHFPQVSTLIINTLQGEAEMRYISRTPSIVSSPIFVMLYCTTTFLDRYPLHLDKIHYT